MNTDLNSLASTLAERLDAELTEYGTNASDFDEGELVIMEAVIREAIEKTLERAREIAQMYRDSKNEHLTAEQCAELIRNRIIDEIHALKPAKVTNP